MQVNYALDLEGAEQLCQEGDKASLRASLRLAIDEIRVLRKLQDIMLRQISANREQRP
jgi:hypothetical protein